VSALTALRSCCDAFEAISKSAIAYTTPVQDVEPAFRLFSFRQNRPGDVAELLKIETICWRTEAGVKAWAFADSGLPEQYRRILGLIHRRTDFESIRAAISGSYSDVQIFAWLDELDTLGFIETDRSSGVLNTELTIQMHQWFRYRAAARAH
jgi:hypothetical protein